jgi:hypothetical protein
MLRKYRALIITVSAVVIAVVAILGVFCVEAYPPLPKSVKEELEAYHTSGITWYHENGNKEEIGVWRYLGKYGKSYVFLVYAPSLFYPFEEPEEYEVLGLQRPVFYPIPCTIVLYHATREFSIKEMFYDYAEEDGDKHRRWAALHQIKNREEWISDFQLERLAKDIEKIAKSH